MKILYKYLSTGRFKTTTSKLDDDIPEHIFQDFQGRCLNCKQIDEVIPTLTPVFLAKQHLQAVLMKMKMRPT